MTPPTPYVLNLDRSRTARAFDPKESLWTPELIRIFRLIGHQAKALDTSQQQEEPPLLAIAVFGGHGSGKTSLLHTLGDRIRNPRKIKQQPESGSENRKKLIRVFELVRDRVGVLPLLKPNILAPRESFLYAFLAAAVEAEQQKAEREGRRSRSSEHYLSPVQQAFQDVSEYLQVIDENGGSQEYDPLGVSLERLERHTSDLRLRTALSTLIGALADRLATPSNSLVLMPVDDADLSQESLSNTLDTYRRYLQHPRLVPIFTFTGRLSEELLTTHFSNKLRGKEASPREGEDWRLFEKQVAHQYFARLFPVRNRIRLGATTVRVQKAKYVVQARPHQLGEEEGAQDGEVLRTVDGEVSKLLETASQLLFGHAEELVEPKVVLALRPGRLRRQLQVLDVLNSTKITHVVAGRYRDAEPAAASVEWAKMFERTAWALLDIHRDVLSPLGLHVEELYGWPSRGLREWVLVRVLEQDVDRRQALLRRWRHRTENRRGQVFSLLAANAFRPALDEDEVVPGQEPFSGVGNLHAAASDGEGMEGRRDAAEGDLENGSGPAPTGGLTVGKGFLWFLGLWLGFYLPQIMTRQRESAGASGTSLGVGWTLADAPMLAIREAKNLGELFGTGIVFLDVGSVRRFIDRYDRDGKSENGDSEPGMRILQMQLWCFHGYEQGRPWVALSFWRGLSFLGHLLKLWQDLQGGGRGSRPDGGADGAEDAFKEEAKRRVVKLLEWHLGKGWVPVSLRPQRQGRDRDAGAAPSSLEKELARALRVGLEPGDSQTREERRKGLEEEEKRDEEEGKKAQEVQKEEARPLPAVRLPGAIRHLARELVDWLVTEVGERLQEPIDPLGQVRHGCYEEDFLWRLHGDALLGELWSKLDKAVLDLPRERDYARNASELLSAWWTVLDEYLLGPGCPGDDAGAEDETGRQPWKRSLRDVLRVESIRKLDGGEILVPATRTPEREEGASATEPQEETVPADADGGANEKKDDS